MTTSGPRAYELMRPEHMAQVLREAPIAYVPVGCMEYHGPHLPLGVDMMTADALCRRTAEVSGGAVLPPLWLASGVLPLPHGIVTELEVLRAVIRSTLQQLANGGFRVIVVFSGHGALDHLHVLREECDRLMSLEPEVRAFTTIWNELTADIDGDIHDHGAKVETSYMLALHPDTVELGNLTDDPSAEHVGVYAANPRFTATREWGTTLSGHVVERLAGIVAGLLDGEPADNWHLLRTLIGRLQAGDLTVVPDSGRLRDDGLRLELHNPHGQSKYITGITNLAVDGVAIDLSAGSLTNATVGEGHTDTAIADLGPLSGFYVRRDQNMVVDLPAAGVGRGRHSVTATLLLADVMEISADGDLSVT